MLIAGCGGGGGVAAPPRPDTGVLLLDLATGAVRAARALPSGPVAVAVAPDGRTAFVSDNAGGRVTALSLPDLATRWTATVGGRPGPLLPVADRVYVSLYEADQVLALQASDGREVARTPACHEPGQLALAGGAMVASCARGPGFALAVTAAGTWRGDYAEGRLLRDDGLAVTLPAHLHPFWLAPGRTGVYVAAEGDDEDADAGAVLAVDGAGSVSVLARPRDPDQVEPAAGRLFVAAHGEREVTVLDAAGAAAPAHWATGTGVVALAADLPLRLLVVVANARE